MRYNSSQHHRRRRLRATMTRRLGTVDRQRAGAPGRRYTYFMARIRVHRRHSRSASLARRRLMVSFAPFKCAAQLSDERKGSVRPLAHWTPDLSWLSLPPLKVNSQFISGQSIINDRVQENHPTTLRASLTGCATFTQQILKFRVVGNWFQLLKCWFRYPGS
jgi:hypothetical protein